VSTAERVPAQLLFDLDRQDVEGRLSRVHKVCCPVDPMRRYWAGAEPVVTSAPQLATRLVQLGRLLEWSYGYRAPRHLGQRLSRRAPSAGGLYPTETFLLVETGAAWRVLYYHFIHQAFFAVPGTNAAAVAADLGLRPGEAAVLLVSALWRTVQRYGVRGYRYCLLDAAHVGWNLASVAQRCGFAASAQAGGLTARAQESLGLEDGEALVLSMVLRPGAHEVSVPRPPRPKGLEHLLPPAAEDTPLLNPVLRRVDTFHGRTLGGDRATLPLSDPACWGPGTGLESWADDRYSAKNFRETSVPVALLERAAQAARDAVAADGASAAGIGVHLIAVRVEGAPVGVGTLTDEGRLVWSGGPEWPSEAMARRVGAACQNQSIAERSSFLLVLTAPWDDVLASGHAGYRPLVLACGFAGAALYREAVRLGLGTTTIGGFSDAAVAALLRDPALHPVAIQAFGVPELEAIKVDAAHVVWNSTPTELGRRQRWGRTP